MCAPPLTSSFLCPIAIEIPVAIEIQGFLPHPTVRQIVSILSSASWAQVLLSRSEAAPLPLGWQPDPESVSLINLQSAGCNRHIFNANGGEGNGTPEHSHLLRNHRDVFEAVVEVAR